MHESIRKSYEFLKKEVDLYYVNACRRQAVEDIAECIYYIGEAAALARILEVNYGEDLKEDKRSLDRIKSYLKYDVLSIVAVMK